MATYADIATYVLIQRTLALHLHLAVTSFILCRCIFAAHLLLRPSCSVAILSYTLCILSCILLLLTCVDFFCLSCGDILLASCWLPFDVFSLYGFVQLADSPSHLSCYTCLFLWPSSGCIFFSCTTYPFSLPHSHMHCMLYVCLTTVSCVTYIHELTQRLFAGNIGI